MDRNFFENPIGNPDLSLSAFWFWNDFIEDAKTSEQLEMMHRINADQPIIHARFGLINEYLSEDWFDRIANALKVCKRNNQKIWLYDENNWPSGNCSWTITKDEKYREHYLKFEEFKINKGEIFTLDLKNKNYINVTAFENGKEINILDMSENFKVEYAAKNDCEILAASVCLDEYEPVGKFCVDYLSKEAISKFIESTHEKYREHFQKDFGKTISGIFMDETRFCNAMPWTEDFPDEFKKRKGYDILPLLHLLKKKTDKSDFIRFDYYDVVSDMYAEATFKQVYDWCEKYNLKSIGHLLGEETIATQSYFGGDMTRGFKYFHVPGLDHLGNGIGSLDAKFVSSASHNYGKDKVACEAFGASGWDMEFEDMVRISNWLFQQGVNLIIMHGFYYSIRDERSCDFPPSYFYQWKYWDHMPKYAKMANRMMEMLSGGRHEADILVYCPMETFWAYFEPDLKEKTGFWENGPWIKDETAKFIDKQFQLLCNKLIDKNLDFDILNADAAENFYVENGKIINKLTGESFSVLILPMVEILPYGAAKLIDEFLKNGGVVLNYKSNIKHIVGKNGEHMMNPDFFKLSLSETLEMRKISDIIDYCIKNINLPFEIISGVDEVSHSHSSYPARLIDPYIHDGERLFGIGVTRYTKDGKRIFNFTNYNMKDEDLTISVKSISLPEIFIPETGEILPVKKFKVNGNNYVFSFVLPKNRTYFIVCDFI